MPPEDLHPHKNIMFFPHDPAWERMLGDSIACAGVLKPVTITKDGSVIHGMARVRAARRMGKKVPVYVVEIRRGADLQKLYWSCNIQDNYGR